MGAKIKTEQQEGLFGPAQQSAGPAF